MRRLLLIAFLLLATSSSYAALSATVNWEIETIGDDNNGGGFNSASSGDDLSLSASATLALSDLATSVLGSSTVISVTGGFTSSMVGNTINIASATANFTTGYYEILTVETSTSIVVDRTPTPAGAGSGGRGRVGGALFSLGKIGPWVVAGNQIWMKYGTYTTTTTTQNVPQGPYSNATGTLNDPVIIQGYEFSRGDATGNKPTYRYGINTVAALITATAHVVNNMILDAAGFTGRGIFPSTPFVVKNSKITGFSSSGISNNGASDSLFIFNTEFSSHTSGAAALVNASGGNVFIFASTFFNNGTHGINNSSSGELMIDHCIFDTNKTGAAGSAITNAGAGQMQITNSVFYNSGAAGIHLASADTMVLLANNIFESNGGWGVNLNAASTYDHVFFYNNAFYNNTSGSIDFAKLNNWQYTGHVEGTTGTFFTDAPNMDFSLNNLTGQGSLVRSLAFPATYTGMPTNSYDDIGAARHQDAGTILSIME